MSSVLSGFCRRAKWFTLLSPCGGSEWANRRARNSTHPGSEGRCQFNWKPEFNPSGGVSEEIRMSFSTPQETGWWLWWPRWLWYHLILDGGSDIAVTVISFISVFTYVFYLPFGALLTFFMLYMWDFISGEGKGMQCVCEIRELFHAGTLVMWLSGEVELVNDRVCEAAHDLS